MKTSFPSCIITIFLPGPIKMSSLASAQDLYLLASCSESVGKNLCHSDKASWLHPRPGLWDFLKTIYTITSYHVSLFCLNSLKWSQQPWNNKYFCDFLSPNLIPPPLLYPSCSSLFCKRRRNPWMPNWAHVQQKCEPLGILFTPH